MRSGLGGLNSLAWRPRGQSYAAMILADNPVAYWRLGETSGIVATDEKGSYNGTYMPNSGGAWTGGTLGQNGIPGAGGDKAALFDGSSGYVVNNNSVLGSSPSAFTIEFWVSGAGSAGGYITAFGYDLGNTPVLGCYCADTSKHLGIFIRNNAGTNVLSATYGVMWSGSNFGHVVVALDSGKINVYLNGTLNAGPISITMGTITLNRTAIAALVRRSASNFFSGVLNGVAIYNYALSASQVLAHYNKGAGL